MVVIKTEWLSLCLHSERISEIVSELDRAEPWLEPQLALDLESELISMRILILQLRGQILARPEEIMAQELLT